MRSEMEGQMQGGLETWLAGQRARRADAKRQAARRWTWGVVIGVPILALLWFGLAWPGGIKAALALGAAAGTGWWGYQPIAASAVEAKASIDAAIAARHGVAYSPEAAAGTEFDAALTYGLIPSFGRATLSGRWHGTIERRTFGFYHAQLEEERGPAPSRAWVRVFEGPVIHLALGRQFQSTTLFERVGRHRTWLGLGAGSSHVSFDGHRLDRVNDAHPGAADGFALFTDDETDARTIVHPALAEHLLRLEDAFEARELRALFLKGAVVIALEAGPAHAVSGTGPRAASDTYSDKAARMARQFSALAGLAQAIDPPGGERLIVPSSPLTADR